MVSEKELNLKQKLIKFKETDYDVSNIDNIEELINDMLENIGSCDSELRDGLIYKILSRLILSRNIETPTVRKILDICLRDDYISKDIEDHESLSVFKRSFSILIIDVILEWNKSTNELSKTDIFTIFERISQIYIKEDNIKGYYEEYGWAHTVAHSADAFADLILSSYIGMSEIRKVIELIRIKFSDSCYYFIDGEDERTSVVIKNILKKGCEYEEVIITWVGEVLKYDDPMICPQSSIIKGNIRNLLRSTYFNIENSKIRRYIENALEAIKYS